MGYSQLLIQVSGKKAKMICQWRLVDRNLVFRNNLNGIHFWISGYHIWVEVLLIICIFRYSYECIKTVELKGSIVLAPELLGACAEGWAIRGSQRIHISHERQYRQLGLVLPRKFRSFIHIQCHISFRRLATPEHCLVAVSCLEISQQPRFD